MPWLGEWAVSIGERGREWEGEKVQESSKGGEKACHLQFTPKKGWIGMRWVR